MTDSYVYKIKKPVDFGFLNFLTLDRRRYYCNEEVRLNRRLCPDMYLGVVEVRKSSKGAAFCGEGEIIDYAVKMKRLPADRMLDRMLAQGSVTLDDMRQIARVIAEFHCNADRGEHIDAYGGLDTIRRNWEENFQQITQFIGITLLSEDLRLIREWVTTYLKGNAELFTKRVNNGFIRDCDGDIHLENICLADRLYIFDCIEFNGRFRYSDTAADIAFLLMDLDFHRQFSLGRAFLAEYIAVTGDREITSVLDFYMIYRAVVRGKVVSLKLLDEHVSEKEKEVAREMASRYFRLAKGYIVRRRLIQSLIITCGLMGTGKSKLAAELAFELGLETINSDAVRKELAGISPASHVFECYNKGIYIPSASEATYHELLKRAEAALGKGRSVLVDAAFGKKLNRALFRTLADRYGVPLNVIHVTCPERIVEQRLQSRMQMPGEVSDGRWELFHQHKQAFEPPDHDEGRLIFIDTSKPVSDNITIILKALEIL
jgi:aminoglycoside phosphotransferase family enzyme/predicted kinase